MSENLGIENSSEDRFIIALTGKAHLSFPEKLKLFEFEFLPRFYEACVAHQAPYVIGWTIGRDLQDNNFVIFLPFPVDVPDIRKKLLEAVKGTGYPFKAVFESDLTREDRAYQDREGWHRMVLGVASKDAWRDMQDPDRDYDHS